MPCYDGYGDKKDLRIQELEAMLCAIMTQLQHTDPNRNLYVVDDRCTLWGHVRENIDQETAGVTVGEIEDWWGEHQTRDKDRVTSSLV